jgi:hypothetical protein
VRRFILSIVAACALAAGLPVAAGAATPIKAQGPVADQVPKFQQAISDRSCDEVLPLLSTLVLRPSGTAPGAPAQPGECDALGSSFFDDLTGFQVHATRNFGTAALVTGEKDGVKEQIWNLDSDGVYRYGFGISTYSDDAAHKLTGKKNAVKTANALVVAIRKHDCKKLAKLTNYDGPLYQGFSSDKAYCKAIFKGHFQKWLRQTPKAKPVFEGGTGSLAFFYVKTKHEVTTLQLNKDALFTNRYYALNYTFNKGKV